MVLSFSLICRCSEFQCLHIYPMNLVGFFLTIIYYLIITYSSVFGVCVCVILCLETYCLLLSLFHLSKDRTRPDLLSDDLQKRYAQEIQNLQLSELAKQLEDFRWECGFHWELRLPSRVFILVKYSKDFWHSCVNAWIKVIWIIICNDILLCTLHNHQVWLKLNLFLFFIMCTSLLRDDLFRL